MFEENISMACFWITKACQLLEFQHVYMLDQPWFQEICLIQCDGFLSWVTRQPIWVSPPWGSPNIDCLLVSLGCSQVHKSWNWKNKWEKTINLVNRLGTYYFLLSLILFKVLPHPWKLILSSKTCSNTDLKIFWIQNLDLKFLAYFHIIIVFWNQIHIKKQNKQKHSYITTQKHNTNYTNEHTAA